jgi:hypothetical protein
MIIIIIIIITAATTFGADWARSEGLHEPRGCTAAASSIRASATDHGRTKRTERDIILKMKRGRDEQSDGAERKILMGICKESVIISPHKSVMTVPYVITL